MKSMWMIFKKEILDNLRDRRSLSTSLLSPLITPVLLIALIVVMGKTLFVDPQEMTLRLPVEGAERAPALMTYLRQNYVEIVAAPGDPEGTVKEGNEEVVLRIPEDYADGLSKGIPAPVVMVMDSSRQSAIPSIERVRNLLQGYSGQVGTLRMQARGIDPALLSALSIQSNDVATPETQTIIFLNMLPFMLIMTIFMGGMYVIIDTTAGERERGSLEPLLINPVPRSQMVMGKLLASLPFALATLALTLTLLYVAFKVIPFEEIIGMPMQLSLGSLLNIFLLSIPLLLFASALQMLVASFTRSFKEAQTYLGFLPLIAGLPSVFLAFLSVKNSAVNMMIPAYSQSLLMNQVLRSETIRMPDVMISTVATLLLSMLLIALSIRLYQREQILFGR